jgi:TonB family protein
MRVICVVFLLLLLYSLTVERQVSAQKEDRGTDEERARILEECVMPDRPKPQVEPGAKRNSGLCGKAISLPKPAYPEEAKVQKVSGTVRIIIVIDEKGRVIWAQVAEGHPLLRDASIKAACRSLHSPLKISDHAVKASSQIVYNFASQ